MAPRQKNLAQKKDIFIFPSEIERQSVLLIVALVAPACHAENTIAPLHP